MSCFIISEVQSDRLLGHSLLGLNSKPTEGRLLTARQGGRWWGGGKGWGLQLWPDLLAAEVGSAAAGRTPLARPAPNDVEEGRRREKHCPAALCLSRTGRYKGGQGCGEIRKGTKRHLQGWKIKEAGTKEFLQLLFFYPFSTLDVNSGKGYELWIQSDIENAVLGGTTHVVQHPLMIQPSVRASGLSSWSCVFGGYVSR